MRSLNKVYIIDAIRRVANGISRAELAEHLGLSRSTVSTIVNELIASGLVVERGAGASRGGRRPIVLQLNPDAGRVVGIDLGATHLRVVVADLAGRILTEADEGLEIARGPALCLEQVTTRVDQTLSAAGCRLADVRAVGMGVPGPVVAEQGMVSAPPIMPGWDGFPIRQHLEAHWHKPTTLDNDADLGALGEWTFGAGQGEVNLAYIKVGTGIGCGLLLDGELYRGVLGTAGEIGHVTISEAGPPCTCGNFGCLEAMAGGRAIAQRAQLAVKAGQHTLLAQNSPEHEITAFDVAQAAEAGDAVGQQLLNDAGRHIGSALASLINLLNPGLVVVGGGVAGAGRFLFEPLCRVVKERTLRAPGRVTRIVPASLGKRSVVLGAASQALTTTFQVAAAPATGLRHAVKPVPITRPAQSGLQ